MSTIKIFDQKGGMEFLPFGSNPELEENPQELENARLSFFYEKKSKEIVPILIKINNNRELDGIPTTLDVTPKTDINTIYTLLNIALDLPNNVTLSDEQYRELGAIIKYLGAILKNILEKNIYEDLGKAHEEYKKELEEAIDVLMDNKSFSILSSSKKKIQKEVSEAKAKLVVLKPEIQKVKELQKLSNEDKEILKNKLNETYKSIKTITNYIIDVYEDEYKTKYLKYKEKYINLKKELEAGSNKKGKKAVIEAEKKLPNEETKKQAFDIAKMNQRLKINEVDNDYEEAMNNLEAELEKTGERFSSFELRGKFDDLFKASSMLIVKSTYDNASALKEKEEAEKEISKLQKKYQEESGLYKNYSRASKKINIKKELKKFDKEMKDIIKINKKQEKDEENLEKSDKEKVTLSEKYKNILSATQNLAKALID